MLASEGGDALVFKVHRPWTHRWPEDERKEWILSKWMFAHRQDAQQLLDGQLWLQTLFEHADGLVLQVIVGPDAAVRQRLDGLLVLNKTRRSLINTPGQNTDVQVKYSRAGQRWNSLSVLQKNFRNNY